MKPSKEQIEAWSCAAIARSHPTDNVTTLYARVANFAYAAGRKAGMEEGFYLGFMSSAEGFNGEYPYGDRGTDPRTDAGWLEDRADAIRAAMEADK